MRTLLFQPSHRARRIPVVAAIAGACVCAGVAGCAASEPRPAALRTSAPTPLSPPVAIDSAYQHAVEAGVAGSLHSTAAQLRSQLRASPGAGLEGLAKPLGVAQDQLAKIVLAGLDGAATAVSRSGRWAGTQAQAEKMYWASQSDATLVTGVSSWFVQG